MTRPEGEQVVVFEGSRQEYDREKNTTNRLNFERYTIDLPDSNPLRQRWREPEERTIWELLKPDDEILRNEKQRYEFWVEIHHRKSNLQSYRSEV